MNIANIIATARYLSAESVDYASEQWKLSNDEKHFLKLLVDFRDSNVDVTLDFLVEQVATKKLTHDEAIYVAMFKADDKVVTEFSNTQIPVFPVNGNDLLDLGLQGKKLGETLNKLREQWALHRYGLDKEDLLLLVKTNTI